MKISVEMKRKVQNYENIEEKYIKLTGKLSSITKFYKRDSKSRKIMQNYKKIHKIE